jgi:zinc D-Ala-D-Ala carboxypeptidase
MSKLTEHFSVEDFQRTEHRTIANAIPPACMLNVVACARLLETVRVLCGNRPIFITSGYRCPELNKAVGGSKTSDHMQGLAADFHVQGMELRDTYKMIMANKGLLRYKQLIYEYGRWVHLSAWPHVSGTSEDLVIYDDGLGYRKWYDGLV